MIRPRRVRPAGGRFRIQRSLSCPAPRGGGIGEPAIRGLAELLKINYLVGYTTSDKVDSYLGRAMMERFQVPQVVVIDRAGVIRAQSRQTGEMDLTDESYLRNLIRGLLNEGAPPGNTEKMTYSPSTAR